MPATRRFAGPRPSTVKTSESGGLGQDIRIPAYAPTGLYKVRVQMPGTAEERRKAERRNE
jgi:uncharacterized protein YfaS (alpha-2-macroglobulin family)